MDCAERPMVYKIRAVLENASAGACRAEQKGGGALRAVDIIKRIEERVEAIFQEFGVG